MKESTDSTTSGKLFAGRYRIIKLIGKGGMGKVYLAEDTFLNNEEIAIKVINKHLSTDPESSERFLREIQLTRKVTHPNVIRTYDAGKINKRLYFTMEYVNGPTLKEVLKEKGKISWPRVANIIIQVCDGLSAIHKEGIVHRDLKPSNVIQTELLVCKIADFGVARPNSSNLTVCEEIVGSTSYMAPEVWTGEGVGAPADLYSLGVMAFELLTGKLPFEAESAPELMWKHLQETAPPVLSLEPEVPRWLSDLIAELLRKDYNLRPALASEIAEFVIERLEDKTDYNSSTLSLHSFEEARELKLALLPPVEPCDPNEAGYFAGKTPFIEGEEDEWLLKAGIEAELSEDKKLEPPDSSSLNIKPEISEEISKNVRAKRSLKKVFNFVKRLGNWGATFLIINLLWWAFALLGTHFLTWQEFSTEKILPFKEAAIATAVFTSWLGLLLASPLFFPLFEKTPLRKLPARFLFIWFEACFLVVVSVIIFSFLKVPWYYAKFRAVPTSFSASFKELPANYTKASPYLMRALFLIPDTTVALKEKRSLKQLRPSVCLWFYSLAFIYLIYLFSASRAGAEDFFSAPTPLVAFAFFMICLLLFEEYIALPLLNESWPQAKEVFTIKVGITSFLTTYGAFSFSLLNWLLVCWVLSIRENNTKTLITAPKHI